MANKRDEYIPVAESIPFDNDTNGFVADDVQTAIEEVSNFTIDSSKSFLLYSYNGNANVGRYLEFFNGISSDDAPIEITTTPLEALTIVSRTTGTSATCTIGYYDISGGLPGTLLHTSTMTAQKDLIEEGTPVLFTLPATGQLAVKVDSGSILKPHIYMIARGG